jgi:DNA polymerase III subunit delta'
MIMNWNTIIGQHRVKTILQRSVATGKISHAYLFYGPEGTGKDAAAIAFAQLLNCENPNDGNACAVCSNCKRIANLQHPNLKLIVPLPVGRNEKEGDDPFRNLEEKTVREYREAIEEKARNPYHRIELQRANSIKINSIREIRKSLNLARAERGKKVVIISRADKMNINAANSLLKTLEEPAHNTVIILTTSHRDRLPATVISRCQAVRFALLREDEIRDALIERNVVTDNQQAILIAKMANGSYVRALELTGSDLVEQREEIVNVLRGILVRTPAHWLRDIEELTRGNDRFRIERSLMLLNLWLRDALMMQHDNDDAIINLDQREPLVKFVRHFKGSDLSRGIAAIERAIALVGKNIYLSLILVNLAFELRQFIVQR